MLHNDPPSDLESFLRSCCADSPYGPSKSPYIDSDSGDVYATDGHIAVRYSGDTDLNLDLNPPDNSSRVSVVDSIISEARSRDGVTLPKWSVQDPLDRTEPESVSKTKDCPHCDGQGEEICTECGQYAFCNHCDGEGEIQIAGTTDHLKWPTDTVVRIPNGAYRISLWEKLYWGTLQFPTLTPVARLPDEETGIESSGEDKEAEQEALLVEVGPLNILLMPFRCYPHGDDAEAWPSFVEVPIPEVA
jgi:hypothetical protein